MQKISTTIFAFSLCALFGLANFALADYDLKGKVTDSTGQPIADVSVLVYTARPRVGPGVL
jgi:hypothetical protein